MNISCPFQIIFCLQLLGKSSEGKLRPGGKARFVQASVLLKLSFRFAMFKKPLSKSPSLIFEEVL